MTSAQQLGTGRKMTNEQGSMADKRNVDYQIDLLKPEDAAGVVELFREVYGNGYPIKLFYDPQKIIEVNQCGDYYCGVARQPDGRVIGVNHLFRSASNPNVYEWGVGLTLKEFRGHGVFNRIGDYLLDVVVPAQGIGMVFGEAVCNHLHSQKMVRRAGFADVAVEIALMPAQIYTNKPGSSGRVAALLQFRTFAARPHKVYLPSRYENDLRFMYSELDDIREFGVANGAFPTGNSCKFSVSNFDFAGVVRMGFPELGCDFDSKSKELEDQARDRNAAVFQVWLPLNQPWVGSAVEILVSRGYFLGGPLFQWLGDDGLLMQKVECDPDFDKILLHSERAEKILALVQADWERSRRV